MSIKLYIAGPMSGIPEMNYPAFHAAARQMAAKGYFVVNPAEICPETGKDWAFYMRKDLREMLRCDAIYLLLGWQGSKGALLERHVAQALGMGVLYEERAEGERSLDELLKNMRPATPAEFKAQAESLAADYKPGERQARPFPPTSKSLKRGCCHFYNRSRGVCIYCDGAMPDSERGK